MINNIWRTVEEYPPKMHKSYIIKICSTGGFHIHNRATWYGSYWLRDCDNTKANKVVAYAETEDWELENQH